MIKINNEKQQSTQIFFPETPKMVQWVIKYSGGLIKDERQANYVLIGFVVVIVVIVLFLIFGVISSPSTPPLNEIIDVAGPQAEH